MCITAGLWILFRININIFMKYKIYLLQVYIVPIYNILVINFVVINFVVLFVIVPI